MISRAKQRLNGLTLVSQAKLSRPKGPGGTRGIASGDRDMVMVEVVLTWNIGVEREATAWQRTVLNDSLTMATAGRRR